jgi:hypothetical protein
MSIGRLALGLLMALAASCGGRSELASSQATSVVGSGTPEYRAGARLVPHFFLSTDADPVFDDWYDTELKVHCWFRQMTGGEWRCIPKTIAYVESTYADAACTRRLAEQWFQSLSPDADSYLVEGTYVDCAFHYRVYRAGADVGVAQTFTKSDAGDCAPTLVTASIRRAVGPAVPDESFVAASLEDQDGDPLQVRYLQAADGAREQLDFVDRARRAVCEPFVLPDGLRCLATPRGVLSSTFLDPECTRPIASGEACAPPAVLTRSDPGTCSTELFAPLGQVELAFRQTFTRSEQTCRAPSNSESDTYTFFEAGMPLAASSFPDLRVELRGQHRIQTVHLLSAGGADRLEPLRFDARLGLPCMIQEGSDSAWRCLPVNLASPYLVSNSVTSDEISSIYSDSACSQPLFRWDAASCRPVPQFLTHYGPVGVDLYSIGVEYSGGTFFRRDPGGLPCMPYDGAMSVDSIWYTTSRLPSLDRFVAFTRQ